MGRCSEPPSSQLPMASYAGGLPSLSQQSADAGRLGSRKNSVVSASYSDATGPASLGPRWAKPKSSRVAKRTAHDELARPLFSGREHARLRSL
jgi:hypothetical protein